VTAIHRAIGAPRGLVRNTTQSTLERLLRKELISRSRRGRAYVYAATVSRSDWVAEALDSVIGEIAASDRDAVLAGFVDFAARSSASTLEALEALVRARLREREGGDER